MSEQFNLQYCQQQIFDQFEAGLFLQFKRSVSGDIFEGGFNNLAKTLNNINQSPEKPRKLLFNMEEHEEHSPAKVKKNSPKTLKIFKKKEKKKQMKGQCDYKKNICGYITKKILREFAGPSYFERVCKLCTKYGCNYSTAKSYYLAQIQRVTGPSHIPTLLVAQNEEEIGIKSAFRQFFEWFLNERYLRYLLLEGKMDQKVAYLRYKNQTLAQILKENL